MISRRSFLAGATAAGAAVGLGACASAPAAGPNVVSYWGLGAADVDKDNQVIDAFKKTDAGKNAEIYVDQVPSSGVADMSQIITAVRGGTAPDVWWMDRFNAVQNASIGLLEPIDGLIEKYEDVSPEEFKSQWIQFAIDELTYDDQLYGLPATTDARGLLYNKDVLKDAGVDLDLFDWKKHVITWDELGEACEKIVDIDKRGNYKRFGFAPWLSEGWPYTWGFGLDAQAYDNETATVTLDSPQWESVYQLYADWAEQYPYASVDAFFATYQPPNAPPTQTAMFSGRLGVDTSGPWQISGNEKYAPDLPLDFTYLPVAKEGDPTYTWSGGQCLVIPKGANITKTLWEFMKFYAGFEGQSIVVPQFGNLPTSIKAIQEKKYNPKAELFRTMLPNSTSRPPLPVGSAMWDTLTRTKSSVALGSSTPKQAVESNQQMIAPKMELFPDYKMPETYGKPSPVPGS
ncbi:extracellular solute-binding protein [Brachybacterium subflavum]|uniref:extracellular solute-binding protein n=1 Tax=Brachybacterium subflavum TaxID=2585206 RepID=UPI0012663334|nr:extracellular solute-binding protein [Brachybacterium subflavum]